MDIAIVGLPSSGKTTIFNAVTRGMADVATYSGAQDKPNMGVAKIPDQRLDVLAQVFEPQRKVPAEVTYVDIPAAPEGLGKTRGISGELLNNLQRADAMMMVVRAFDDPSVPHPEDGIDSSRDAEAMLYELIFADLEIMDRRIQRLADGLKGAKAPERDAINRERALLDRLRGDLESGALIRSQSLGQEEVRLLEGFQFLTAKPLIVVANVGETQMADTVSFEKRLSSVADGPKIRTTSICGKLEMELAQMEPTDEQEFRESLELGESGLDRMIRLSHDILDLITFFTGNANEVRAWPITRGTTAVKAAGKVHSDFERGFIRAEVVKFEDLARCRSIAQARRQGALHQEGKSYLVADGDVMNILFNV